MRSTGLEVFIVFRAMPIAEDGEIQYEATLLDQGQIRALAWRRPGAVGGAG
jgi:hypothetical protein